MSDDFSRLSRALDKQMRRRGQEVFEPPQVKSVGDIKRLINELGQRGRGSLGSTIGTQISATDDRSVKRQYQVRATVKEQTKYDILYEGLAAVRRQLELAAQQRRDVLTVQVNGKSMVPAGLPQASGYCWADPLIKRWLGAARDGLLIYWDLDGYRYQFDILEHRLTKVEL